MKKWMLAIGPIAALIVRQALLSAGHDPAMAWTAAVMVLCALWWIFEPIPIAATSLIPLAVLPLVGVLDAAQVGEAYGDSLVLLMMGGFMLSMAMERSGAHRRIALGMIRAFRGHRGGRRLVFGFMAASGFISMWISNAATVLMLLPIALAAIEKSTDRRLRTCVLLGVAYAASIGGIGTPIGTPPNLVFMKFYTEVAGGQEPSFTTWMSWAMPTMLIMLPATGLWLTRGLKSSGSLEAPAVEKWRYQEIATLIVFALTAALWITRKEPWGGWSQWLGLPGASDASVALLAVIAMHLLPDGKGETLLTWDDAKRIPWGVLILYGGGIAIAKAFEQSGLDDLIASSLTGLTHVPVVVMIALVCLAVTFLTEVTSNTATANLVLPILAATALAAAIDPRLIMVPATISASFAFMLPVGTPPNAIVYGTGDVTIEQMAREGFVINLIGVVVVTVVCYFTFQ